MHRIRMFCLSTAVLAFASAALASPADLLQQSTLPFQAPPFDRIKDADFGPAFDEAMAKGLQEFDAIANNPAPPTFENTVVAMEKSDQALNRVQLVFSTLTGANTDDALQKVEASEAPKLAAHQDAIFLNPKLFARVDAVYQKRDSLHLDPESRQLLDVYYRQFVHAGAKLSEADKAKLKDLNKQISTLETAFEQKLLAAAKDGALVIDNKADLAGLSDDAIAAAAKTAEGRGLKGKWVIPLQNTTQQPALQSLANRDVRERLFHNSWTRAERGDANDTRATISTLANLRAIKAKLIGYPNYAAYVLEDQMAKTPEAVEKFLAQLIPPTAAESRREAKIVQAQIDKDGQHFQLKPWDWERYAEEVRKAQYDLDEDEIKPYFEVNNVLEKGVFYAANQLYGVTFKERHDLPVWHPDVRVFTVYDKDGSELGLAYFDYFKRDNKQGGAWMSNLVGQSTLLGTKPVIYNVANFTKPAPGKPALISFDDVTTMFHEFGHGLHGLFAKEKYPTLSGTNVARDFVEFPSQFNEHWALYPDVLKHYAKNYKTGAPMPDALVAKIKKAATFNQGYMFGELLAADKLDMSWHELTADAPKQDVDQFEQKALASTGLDVDDVPPRYRTSYFLHIWSNGYAAGYYAYTWTEMLDDDAYHWFATHGGMTRANGQRFRDLILSRGHTMDYGEMFRAFFGRDPDITPLLAHRGLVPGAD
ncbi:MAG TPA: M3 family metallopeptidase [Rhizomicrobium sp.]|nr:M3 family metallopeptidase [Rhizomicrobium sp.]